VPETLQAFSLLRLYVGTMIKFISRTFALITFVLIALVISPTISNRSVQTAQVNAPGTFALQNSQTNVMQVNIVAQKDNRAEKLKAYFAKNRSPFTPYATNFVQVADKYDLDWTLLPAIAKLESQLGIRIPAGSYNPYGWNNGKYFFKSFENANEVVANGIRTRYAPTGKVTAARIGKKYAASPTWASRVSRYQIEISKL